MERLTAVVHGRVQGVSFRYYTLREARRLGLVGWVANRPDGTVGLEAEGEPAALAALESWLHEGPTYAKVTRVESQRGTATGEFDAFRVRGY